MKRFFFDRPVVINAVGKARVRSLSREGAYIRRAAISSIRDRPYGKYSLPGDPPFAHVGYSLRKENRRRKRLGMKRVSLGGFKGVKHILFAYDAAAQSVVVGPISNRGGGVTHALEFGGRIVTPAGPARMEARPFMGPAAVKAKADLSKFWRDSVRA